MPSFELNETAIVLREGDDVAVLTQSLSSGSELEAPALSLRLTSDIPAGHKIALTSVADGQPVHKYGQIIGFATRNIEPGDWVHSHNLHNGTVGLDYEFGTDIRPNKPLGPSEARTFMGFARQEGRSGTRNFISLVSTVNCSADTVHLIADKIRREALSDFPNVD